LPSRTLQSPSAHLLHQPFASISLVSRSFSFVAPAAWNKLSVNTEYVTSLGAFRSSVKTELLFTSVAYPT